MDQIWLCFERNESQGEGGQQPAFLNGACLLLVSRIGCSPGRAGQHDLVSPVTLQGLLCVCYLRTDSQSRQHSSPCCVAAGILCRFQQKAKKKRSLARRGKWGQRGAWAVLRRPKASSLAGPCSLPAVGRLPWWLSGGERLGALLGSWPCRDTTGVSPGLTWTRANDLVFPRISSVF